MNNLTIEPKIIIFGPLLPISYKLVHENDKTQLANNYTITFVLLCWLFLILSSQIQAIFFMSVKIDYMNFHEKDMTIFAEKKKKCAKKEEERQMNTNYKPS